MLQFSATFSMRRSSTRAPTEHPVHGWRTEYVRPLQEDPYESRIPRLAAGAILAAQPSPQPLGLAVYSWRTSLATVRHLVPVRPGERAHGRARSIRPPRPQGRGGEEPDQGCRRPQDGRVGGIGNLLYGAPGAAGVRGECLSWADLTNVGRPSVGAKCLVSLIFFRRSRT